MPQSFFPNYWCKKHKKVLYVFSLIDVYFVYLHYYEAFRLFGCKITICIKI